MRKTWEEGVLSALQYTNFAHYTMPRQTGTTTFLILLANKWINEGHNVVYVSYRKDVLQYLKVQGVQDLTGLYPPVILDKRVITGALDTIVNEYGDVTLKGTTVDRLILDNVGHNPASAYVVEELRFHLTPQSKTVWIDTI